MKCLHGDDEARDYGCNLFSRTDFISSGPFSLFQLASTLSRKLLNSQEAQKLKMPDNSNDVCCKGCQQKFPSRNKMFQHLKETDGACLGPEDYTDFCKYVRTTDEEKVVILYGYLSVSGIIRNGYDAARTLVKAMKQWERQRMNNGSNTSATAVDNKDNGNDNIESVKFHRSYGHDQRGVETVKQDEETGAITEVLSLKLQTIKNVTVDQWLDQVQSILDQQLSFLGHHPTPIRILGRQPMKFGKFNAEMDVSHRRVEYLLPVDFLSWPLLLEKSNNMTLHKQLESLPSFSENQNHALPKQGEEANIIVSEERNLLQNDSEVRQYLYQLKKIMQMLATPIVKLDVNDKSAVLEKGFSLQKRKQQQASKNSNRKKKTRQESAKKRGINDEIIEETISNTLDKEGAQNRLKRKRFHNFTATMMGMFLSCLTILVYCFVLWMLPFLKFFLIYHCLFAFPLTPQHMNTWRFVVWIGSITDLAFIHRLLGHHPKRKNRFWSCR